MTRIFQQPITYLKGVGPQKAALLEKELQIFTYGDLLQHYPFRYEDRTKIYPIREVNEHMGNVQIKGAISRFETIGQGRKKRLVGYFQDEAGSMMELVWFKGISWVLKSIRPGVLYLAYGKPNKFGQKLSIAHPELEVFTPSLEKRQFFMPVYPLTEKLRKHYLDNKAFIKLQQNLLAEALPQVVETLPEPIRQQYSLMGKAEAVKNIHIPANQGLLQKARYRLKFEEFFFLQIRFFQQKQVRLEKFRGQVFSKTHLLTEFYEKHLPFDLTNAQKRVIKEIFADMKSGQQMNRLLQGDVGSGKTIVAFITMLLALDGGAQAAMMAPTEILATQHYHSLKPMAKELGLHIALLTGSTKQSERKIIHQMLVDGDLPILVGTHALLEEKVVFQNLGLAIVDEQHRFGVAQRARLWKKNNQYVPHVLVMTATPIPRTLSMAVYGDLDISVIDELPAGRKPIKTLHQYDAQRLKVNGFLKKEIEKGRQVYIVYPLVEESEKLDLKDLMDGYESVCRAFPQYPVSIVHGRMKAEEKEFEMQRFLKAETKIMVATTVIEVGVNVPNATVMVIENAERFGLSQLHQLRGRVGRGGEQSYCLLMSDYKLSKEARTRIQTMVRTTDGFEIANVDLQLRGPGDMMGTRQSGQLDLLMADLKEDGPILSVAREAARNLMEQDPDLEKPENHPVKAQIAKHRQRDLNWSRIS